MTFKKGFVISIVSLALSTTAFAMSRHEDGRRQDRDERGSYRPVAYREHRDHDRDRDRDDRHKGWEKGKKEGWHGNNLPPGQAKKDHRDWDHDRDAREHHEREWRERREREARERRRIDWERHHHREHRPVAQTPIKPMPPRPVASGNHTWGDNVRARKTQIKTQQTAQQTQPGQQPQQGPYIKK